MHGDAVEEPDEVVASFRMSKKFQQQVLGYTIMNGGHIIVADTMTTADALEIGFPKDKLKPGVNQLTLFTGQGRILAERLFFICPKADNASSVTIESRTEVLSRCGKVSLSLHALPGASLSFSAVDAGTMVNGTYGNIAAYMLLSSDVRGYIPHPEYYFESDDHAHRMAADTLMMVNGWRRYDWNVMADETPWKYGIQKIEDKLYVFGKLRRSLNKWKKSNPIEDVKLTAFLYNEKGEHLKGEAVTDSAGRYAFELPDIDGEWNMQIFTKRDDKLKSYTIAIDRQFAPDARYISKGETSMLPHTQPNLFIQPDASLDNDEENMEMKKTGDKQYALPTANIKRKKSYWLDYDGGWYNEHDGQLHANLYYDCDRASDAIADKGEVIPTLYEWLASQNNMMKLDLNEVQTDGPADRETSEFSYNISQYGTTYNNRPTVWILNNKYCGTTGGIHGGSVLKYPKENGLIVLKPNIQPPPVYLDEVKSVYILTDQVEQANNYISGISKVSPVVIFVYTHPTYTTESSKGLRRTHFQGYNIPTKFEMEDYSIVPPVTDDFRRTLFWKPDVNTDKDGNAEVEFFNNSTCKDIYISVEGMTQDGMFINYPLDAVLPPQKEE